MCDDEEVFVVNSLATKCLAHQSLTVQNFVQLQIFTVHHPGGMVSHIDSFLWITRPAVIVVPQM